MKMICVDRSKCNGCGACQSICSMVKQDRVQPAEARIRLQRAGGAKLQYVTYCQHCADPECLKACLKTIIRKDGGLVLRNFNGCFACSACEVACPMGAVVYDSCVDAYMTCDQCGGDPVCVKICPTGALSFVDAAEACVDRRAAYAAQKVDVKERV